jgi:serine/threonine protein kinase
MMELKEGSMVEEFKELFVKIVAYDASERYSIEEIIEHSWLKNGAVERMRAEDYQ